MKCLYFTYDGLLDPLGQSQVLPYLDRLTAAGHTFVILSYEKKKPREEIDLLEARLRRAGIEWHRLSFRSGRLEFFKRVLAGCWQLRRLAKTVHPELVHLRGLMPAVMFQLSRLRLPHLYDFRGFALEEWTELGKIRKDSISYRVLRRLDRQAVASACGLVVLEDFAAALLRRTYSVPDVPLKVIRTCTDIALFPQRKYEPSSLLRLVCVGGARWPYRPDLALRFAAQLRQAGVDCRLAFFNERDHACIAAAIEATNFPREDVAILKAEHHEIPAHLGNYDCGLVFCETSPWRRVCSPTKVGEYLAAGLPVISLNGIDVLEKFADSTTCVKILQGGEFAAPMSAARAAEWVRFVRAPGVATVCRELANREFSMERAGRLYTEIYAEIQDAR